MVIMMKRQVVVGWRFRVVRFRVGSSLAICGSFLCEITRGRRIRCHRFLGSTWCCLFVFTMMHHFYNTCCCYQPLYLFGVSVHMLAYNPCYPTPGFWVSEYRLCSSGPWRPNNKEGVLGNESDGNRSSLAIVV